MSEIMSLKKIPIIAHDSNVSYWTCALILNISVHHQTALTVLVLCIHNLIYRELHVTHERHRHNIVNVYVVIKSRQLAT